MKALISAVESVFLASGLFGFVNTHEPKSAPQSFGAAIWVQAVRPIPTASGMGATTALVTVTARLFGNMIAEPQDEIDPAMLDAVSVVLGDLTSDLTLNGTCRNIDLLGETGESLSMRAGYAEYSGKLFRVMDITVPCIKNDVWSH